MRLVKELGLSSIPGGSGRFGGTFEPLPKPTGSEIEFSTAATPVVARDALGRGCACRGGDAIAGPLGHIGAAAVPPHCDDELDEDAPPAPPAPYAPPDPDPPAPLPLFDSCATTSPLLLSTFRFGRMCAALKSCGTFLNTNKTLFTSAMPSAFLSSWYARSSASTIHWSPAIVRSFGSARSFPWASRFASAFSPCYPF